MSADSNPPAVSPASSPREHPLANILANVLVPVLFLTQCSKDGSKFWHFGPYWAMGLALAIPVFYGIWHFARYRRMNIFSAVGFFNVLLTGALTIYLYSLDDPDARRSAPWLFGIKEAVQPLILGSLFLITHGSRTPLFNAFIYNHALFDHSRIDKAIAEKGNAAPLARLLWTSTLLFFGSFCLSAAMNLGLAHYFLGDLDPSAPDWKELYNEDVGRITGWGFLVIGAPLLFVSGFILWRLVRGIGKLTGLETGSILQAR